MVDLFDHYRPLAPLRQIGVTAFPFAKQPRYRIELPVYL